MAEKPKTASSPSQRASTEMLDRQAESLRHLPYAAQFLDAAAALVVILNPQRQIVFASREFRELMRTVECGAAKQADPAIGLRPGEALDCIHSDETSGGCGTTAFCQVCGMNNAVLRSQSGHETVEECRMRKRGTDDQIEALDLRVWARPLDIDGDRFTMVTIQDVSDEKHRRSLERIFFHDVLNTAGGVHGLARILADTNLDEEHLHRTADLLCYSSEQLIEEIDAYRIFRAAERNELITEPCAIELRSYVAYIADLFTGHEVARDREVFVVPGEVHVESDKILLRRVVLNLLKNALEASKPGETVKIDVWQEDDSVKISILNRAVMTPETKLQVFNRSFSTRGANRGIGTYSAKLITERYLHGKLTFKSESPHGTEFTVSLPEAWPE